MTSPPKLYVLLLPNFLWIIIGPSIINIFQKLVDMSLRFEDIDQWTLKGRGLAHRLDLTPQLLGQSSQNLQNMFIGVPETSPESFFQIDY